MDYRIFQRSYDTFAQRYDEVFEAQQRPKIEALVAAAGEATVGAPLPEPIVDLGAGTGLFARLTGAHCVEVDVSRAMLTCPLRPRCVQADLEHLPFADASLGTLVSVTSLIDFGPALPALTEWRRVLRPAGLLLLSVLKREDLPALERGLARERFTTLVTLDLGPDWGMVSRREG